MTKLAHISSRPGHEVGERVLALCGKEFKVKVLWDDVPADKPICRACVDTSLKALTEADELITTTRSRVRRLSIAVQVLSEVVDAGLLLDDISEKDADHLNDQFEKALTKAEEKRAKQTCTCVWEDGLPSIADDCPIHGGHLDAEPVDIGDAETVEES